MELRKDPITRSWSIVGHREETRTLPGGCPLCPAKLIPGKRCYAFRCRVPGKSLCYRIRTSVPC